MAERICLRCDWTGGTEDPACPRCGAPLYVMDRSRPARAPAAEVSGPRDVPTETARQDEPPGEGSPPPAGPAERGRWRVIVLAVVLTGAVAFALARGGGSDPEQARNGDGRILAEPSAASPTAPPPVSPRTCSNGPVPQIPEPADIVPVPTADYVFQGSLESSLGHAPELAGVGGGSGVFTVDGRTGTTVLRFAGGRGLTLTPTTGVIPSSAYTIELLFRFDFVSEYRKIVDFRGGSDDSGLYVLDGCLTFFPKEHDVYTPIAPDAYVQVVLTRDHSGEVVAYVDGVRQFAFADRHGLAEVNEHRMLRFFVDDHTTTGEHSSGAVSQIRLFDQPLTASEVATLACTEFTIADATPSC